MANSNFTFKAEELNRRYTHCHSQAYDWSTGFGDEWHIVFPDSSFMDEDECKAILDDYGMDYHGYGCLEDLQEQVEETYQDNIHDFVPMMNFFIDLDDDFTDHGEIASKLMDTCFTAVTVNDRIGVALTGGGMNMTWQIVRAFAALGSLPPLQYARLSDMCEHDADVIKACNRTLESFMAQHQLDLEHNISLLEK